MNPHGEFSVCQFFVGDAGHEYDVRNVDAATAAARFKALTSSVGARIGTTERVIITDGGDFTAAEWKFGEGVTFPPEWVKAAAAAGSKVPR